MERLETRLREYILEKQHHTRQDEELAEGVGDADGHPLSAALQTKAAQILCIYSTGSRWIFLAAMCFLGRVARVCGPVVSGVQ